MKVSSPALLPFFGSENQLRVLALLYVNAPRAYSIVQIASETGASEPTASREVAKFTDAGLLTTESVGRTKLVRANTGSPYFEHLQALLLLAAGPSDVLRKKLSGIRGIDEAFIFGSWARRYQGEVGDPPRDLDVLVIGNPNQRDVDKACRRAEERLGLEVNPIVVSREEWKAASSGFLRQLKKSPLVPLIGHGT